MRTSAGQRLLTPKLYTMVSKVIASYTSSLFSGYYHLWGGCCLFDSKLCLRKSYNEDSSFLNYQGFLQVEETRVCVVDIGGKCLRCGLGHLVVLGFQTVKKNTILVMKYMLVNMPSP